MSAAALRGWTPVHVHANAADTVVDWAIVDEPFTDPFFAQTAARAMQRPFNLAFGRSTGLEALDAVRESAPGIAPAGFIFHMSRCGSTLIAQMLSRLASTVVLSEAQPLDALLRSRRQAAGLGDERLPELLRAMLSALAQARFGETRLFVKFHAWHVFELPFIARVFPNVPWIFVFREPRAVLRSQIRLPGAEAIPGLIDPHYVGLDVASAIAMPAADYAARFVRATGEAALRYAGIGRAAFVDYATLPDFATSELLDFFGVRPGEEDVQRMRDVARLDTKSAGTAFAADTGARDPGGLIERLATDGLDAAYARLRAAARLPSDGSSG